MLTRIITITCLIFSFIFSVQAKKQPQIDLSDFLTVESSNFNDIGYVHLIPQYEENPDPKKAVAIEIYFGEYDDTPESDLRLKQMREVIETDYETNPNVKTNIKTLSNRSKTMGHSKSFQNFQRIMKVENKKAHHEQIPNFLDYTSEHNAKKINKRYPSSINGNAKSFLDWVGPRKIWTVIRFSSGFTGVAIGLTLHEGMTASLLFSVSIWPALASGAIAYYNNAFGSFLTNGKISKWLLTSDRFFARKFREKYKLNPVSLKEALIRNRPYFREKFPVLYEKNPDLFEKSLETMAKDDIKSSKERMVKILSRLETSEEYIKWFVTEVVFVAAVFNSPSLYYGVTEYAGFMATTGDVMLGAVGGMFAQGFGDIAIQKRKYQMIEELKKNITSGKLQFDNQAALLAEIEKVLAKTGDHANYLITDASHLALRQIEAWAMSRATILSFFSVLGVGLNSLGLSVLARPLIITVGVAGYIYYKQVTANLDIGSLKGSFKNYVEKIKSGQVKLSLQFLPTRYCSSSFTMKPN